MHDHDGGSSSIPYHKHLGLVIIFRYDAETVLDVFRGISYLLMWG